MSHKHDESGSGTVEIILIIVVVALVGAVGWLVYDRQSNKESSSTANVSKVTSAEDSETSPKAATYLKIGEWGVKVPLSDEYADATYSIETGPGIAVSGVAGISIDGEEVGYFDRYKVGDTVYDPAGDDMGKFDQAYMNDNPGIYTKVGDYYYTFIGSQGAGSDKQNALASYLVDARKNLEAI